MSHPVATMAPVPTAEILFFDGFDDLDAIAPLEVLTAAGFDVRAVSFPDQARPVRSAHGLVLTLPGSLGTAPELVIVPGGGWFEHGPGARTLAQDGALPDRLVDQERREVDGEHGAAWGDPAIVLRCGVDEPDGFDELSTCQVVNDVAWYIPEEQVTGQPVDIVMTTVGRRPNVEVSLPADYFPPAAAMAQLSEALLAHSTEVEPCG